MSTAVAIEDLENLTGDEFQQRLAEVCQVYGWQFDPAVRVLWLPDWVERNPPQSPNVVASWVKLLRNVPDCAIKFDAIATITDHLKDMPEAFRKPFASYRASLSNSKAQPKAKAGSYQGSGIQGSGIRDTAHSVRWQR